MVDFTWQKTDAKLTRPVNQDGLGMSVPDRNSIIIEQRNMDYVFNWHSSYHGNNGGGHYVYIREGDSKSRNLPRAWISGPKAGTVDGSLSTKVTNDVRAVVGNANNRMLLEAACKRYYQL